MGILEGCRSMSIDAISVCQLLFTFSICTWKATAQLQRCHINKSKTQQHIKSTGLANKSWHIIKTDTLVKRQNNSSRLRHQFHSINEINDQMKQKEVLSPFFPLHCFPPHEVWLTLVWLRHLVALSSPAMAQLQPPDCGTGTIHCLSQWPRNANEHSFPFSFCGFSWNLV